EEIISLLSKSKKPLRAKEIASELKKTNSNIRKILSNLHKEGKITRAGFGKYSVLTVNETVNESVNVSVNVKTPEAKKLINREINKYRRTYFQRLKIKDPEAYGKMRKAKNRYLRDWRVRNPDYNKNWLKEYYKKYPERVREYQRRYWLRRAMSSD
ncbi:MAG: ArsR family transcriptional regulator, partial [Clostridia bacterium]|nr:ArsR family transcriptional regulator [Clostridia bacterium]